VGGTGFSYGQSMQPHGPISVDSSPHVWWICRSGCGVGVDESVDILGSRAKSSAKSSIIKRCRSGIEQLEQIHFITRRSNDDGHWVEARICSIEPGAREYNTIDNGMERHCPNGHEQFAGGLSLRGDDVWPGHRAQCVDIDVIETGAASHFLSHKQGPFTIEK
jgi:hypothetical protein